MPITANKTTLKTATPHVIVGTPGRILGLLRSKDLKLEKLKHFVLDECDRMLEALGECTLCEKLASLRENLTPSALARPRPRPQTCARTSRRSSARPRTRSK